MKGSYLRFAAMIATSTVVMFVLMYLNTYAWEHVFFSETRAYMAVLMGATMAFVMLAFMLGMYANNKANVAIFLGAIVVFAGSLWLVRSQVTVSGPSYMRAMIPHHSIAIMTSERAGIEDARVRKLANGIIEAQEREIAEMRYLIADLSGNDSAKQADIFRDPPPQVGTIADALSNTLISTLDPGPLTPDQADDVLGAGPHCGFRRTVESDPILWTQSPEDDAATQAVMELNGVIVPLEARADAASGDATFEAEGVAITVHALSDDEADTWGRLNAELLFQLDEGLTVGYRGFFSC